MSVFVVVVAFVVVAAASLSFKRVIEVLLRSI